MIFRKAKLNPPNIIRKRLSADRIIPTIQVAEISINVPSEAKRLRKNTTAATPRTPPEPIGKL
jgi:hypothetical protein